MSEPRCPVCQAGPNAAAKPLPLFTFTTPDGDTKRLRTPLLLRVTTDGGEIFVENEALNIFGQGKTLHAAIEAFSRDVAYFWQYYRELGDDQVAGAGVTLKRLYEELVA